MFCPNHIYKNKYTCIIINKIELQESLHSFLFITTSSNIVIYSEFYTLC